MTTILTLVHVVAAAAAIGHLLLTYRRPAAAVAWMFALVALPLVGPLLYVMLAVPVGRRTLRRREKSADIRGEHARRRPEGNGTQHDDRGFAALIRRVRAFPPTDGNSVELLVDPEKALAAQLDAIRGAEREVLLSTYVLKAGRAQRALVDALADRAAAGVAVRLLIDPVGSHELPGSTFKDILARGIEAHTFMSLNPFKGRLQINFRNHRKILAVDGEAAFTGGRNWSDEYYPAEPGAKVFRDLTVGVRGRAATNMRRVFLEDWALATGDERALSEPGPEAVPNAGERTVRVQPFGPDEPRSSAIDELLGAFRAARDSILIVTPYFVPGGTLQHALRIAALAGVEIDILTPRRCGKRSIDLASRHYLDGLLDAGVRVHWRDPPLLHSKAVVVDDRWSSVGSLNFDARSVHLNYELNLEVLGGDFARALRDTFADDLERAEQVDAERFLARGRWQRVKEKAAALFEPLM